MLKFPKTTYGALKVGDRICFNDCSMRTVVETNEKGAEEVQIGMRWEYEGGRGPVVYDTYPSSQEVEIAVQSSEEFSP